MPLRVVHDATRPQGRGRTSRRLVPLGWAVGELGDDEDDQMVYFDEADLPPPKQHRARVVLEEADDSGVPGFVERVSRDRRGILVRVRAEMGPETKDTADKALALADKVTNRARMLAIIAALAGGVLGGVLLTLLVQRLLKKRKKGKGKKKRAQLTG